MKNILVACNFSAPIVHAYKFAHEISLATGGKLSAVNIIDPDVSEELKALRNTYGGQISHLSEAMEKAENDFEILKSSIGGDHAETSFSVEVGTLKEIVVRIVFDKNIDLVVTWTSKEVEYGVLLSEIIAESAPIPFFILDRESQVSELKKNLLLLPETVKLTNDAIAKLQALLGLFGAELHVADKLKRHKKEMECALIAVAARNKEDLMQRLRDIDVDFKNSHKVIWAYISWPI